MAQATSTSSLAAVKSAAANLRDKVEEAIRAFGGDGLTTNECAELLDIDKGSVQPRTSELFNDGRIRPSGLFRRNVSGKKAIVWVGA